MKNSKILVLGSEGMVGSALIRKLYEQRHINIIGADKKDIDLTKQNEVNAYFEYHNPEIVLIAAAKAGGILANNIFRAQFIYENLMIAANVIHASFLNQVKKLIFLGSSCIYPKFANQPMSEHELLKDKLEYTNEPNSIAKIAGIKLCESYYRQYNCNFFSVMPTNLYGPFDNFDLNSSHVLPALIRKFHEAKDSGAEEVVIWGSGTPKREFLYVDDLADAVLHILHHQNAKELYQMGVSHINIGAGQDLSIKELSLMIKDIVGFDGDLIYDVEKPDGTPRKLLDVTLLNSLGWKPKVSLEEGVRSTYKWYLENHRKLNNSNHRERKNGVTKRVYQWNSA
jgi:GDP-L-fucose synthase